MTGSGHKVDAVVTALAAVVGAVAFVVSCSLLDPLDDISNGARQSDARSMPDAPADASQTPKPPACDSKKPFGPPTLITSLLAPLHEVNARFLPDELTVFFQVKEADDSNHLYTASRPSLGAPFTTPKRVDVLNSADSEGQPTLTGDGRTIFFSRWPRNNSSRIYTSRRPTLDAAFAPPSQLPILQNGGVSGPYVVPDGNALYYVAGDVVAEIHRATKAETGFSDGILVSEIGSDAGELDPTVTPDELTIYFASFRTGQWDIWMATRAKRDGPFSNIHPVEELNTSFEEYAAWISADGCRLYFSSNRLRGDSDHDLYVAERGR
jgi:Tol biopolymer transport system component